MKGTFHKGCSCSQCMRGKRTDAGHQTQNANERKLRRMSKKALDAVVKHGAEDAVVAPISTPYTD